MDGTITFATFGYGFANAVIQTDPALPPAPGKVVRFIAAEGLELMIPFADKEQWAEFQRQVAAEEFPSTISLPSPADTHKINGSKLI